MTSGPGLKGLFEDVEAQDGANLLLDKFTVSRVRLQLDSASSVKFLANLVHINRGLTDKSVTSL